VTSATEGVLAEVAAERVRQDAKHGHPRLPLGFGPDVVVTNTALPASEAAEAAKRATDSAAADGTLTHLLIIEEEWRESVAEADPQRARAELVQAAATIVKCIEDIDRQASEVPVPPKTPCAEGFYWIGQSFATCDQCGLPAWEHAGMAEPDGDNPFGGGRGFHLRPWKPGEAEACRRKWEVVSR
jgi:hypothetical protein